MDMKDNSGKKIGSINTYVSSNKSVTVNETKYAKTVTTTDRTTGKVSTETFHKS
jgi:hypothetical protein